MGFKIMYVDIQTINIKKVSEYLKSPLFRSFLRIPLSLKTKVTNIYIYKTNIAITFEVSSPSQMGLLPKNAGSYYKSNFHFILPH